MKNIKKLFFFLFALLCLVTVNGCKKTPHDDPIDPIYKKAQDMGYQGSEDEWKALIAGSVAEGKEIELKIDNETIKWRYRDEDEWLPIYSVDDLIGPFLNLNNLQTKLNEIFNEYLEASKAAIKLTLGSGNSVLATELSYELGNDKLYRKAAFVQTNSDSPDETSLYLKENEKASTMIYLSVNGVAKKYEAKEFDLKTLSEEYGIKVLLEKPNAFYKDDALFRSLKNGESDKENVFSYELDIPLYTKEEKGLLDLCGKDKIELLVTVSDETIVAVELKVTEENTVNTIKVEYLGFDVPIVYPDNLDQYEDQE